MKRLFIFVCVLCVVLLSVFLWTNMNRSYTAEELGIQEIKNLNDQDHDGRCDSEDIVQSAREYLFSGVTYQSGYYAGGYPDDQHGVCTDVIIMAFLNSGYDLKQMIDYDIASCPEAYPHIVTADPNIDFRRVINQRIFFERHAQSLSTQFNNPEDFQAGDIIVYANHIGICSDLRNKAGFPFLLHFLPSGPKENNALNHEKIIGHYRFP